MNRKPRDPQKAIISKKDWITIYGYAFLMTLAVMAAIAYCTKIISVDPKTANNVAFITLTFAQLFHVFNMSSKHSNLFVNEVTKNKFIWLALIICVALLVLVYAVPQLRLVLGLEVLPSRLWVVSILASLIPLVLVQGYKIIWERKNST